MHVSNPLTLALKLVTLFEYRCWIHGGRIRSDAEDQQAVWINRLCVYHIERVFLVDHRIYKDHSCCNHSECDDRAVGDQDL